jgi:cytochrome c oxidase cbb3-type subunit III
VKHERALLLVAVATAAWACNAAPGRPTADSEVMAPSKIVSFDVLYASNCAGCHGASGSGGLALRLADPVYLAIADDQTIRRAITEGVRGSAMPAFALSSGGALTADQIDAIVHGMRTRWAHANELAGADPPPYAAAIAGDGKRGADVYAKFCASCHGADGHGGEKASAIVDRSYLALVSDQYLRTTVIAGRPDLGAPDWRNDLPGTPLSSQDVSDVVAWLATWREAR